MEGMYIRTTIRQATARNFLVAWLKHLQGMKRNLAMQKYGWTDDGGFAFDDKIYRQNGIESVCSAAIITINQLCQG